MPTKSKAATTKEQDLNRWCIEMAMKWPTVSIGGYGNAVGVYQQNLPRQDSDADIIGRANKIMAWVKSSH